MNTQNKADIRHALDVLMDCIPNDPQEAEKAIAALRQLLEQPEQGEVVVKSNGRVSPLLTHMMNKRAKAEAQPAPVQEPVAWVDSVMEQAQVFASAWALVGSRFDSGNEMENAEQQKKELRAMLTTPPAQPTGDKLTPDEAQPADHIRDATKMGATAEESSGVEPRKHYQWDDGMRLLSDIAPQHKGNT